MVPKSLPHQNLVKLFSETGRSHLFCFLHQLNKVYYTLTVEIVKRCCKNTTLLF